MTVNEAAKVLEVSPGRMRQLVAQGRIPVEKKGRDNFIKKADLEEFQKNWKRSPGRPRKK